MAKRCDICGKEPIIGRRVSHAHNVSPRRWIPNLQRVRVNQEGKVRRITVCTACIRAGKVTKAL